MPNPLSVDESVGRSIMRCAMRVTALESVSKLLATVSAAATATETAIVSTAASAFKSCTEMNMARAAARVPTATVATDAMDATMIWLRNEASPRRARYQRLAMATTIENVAVDPIRRAASAAG